ncbi:MAG: hypothetical protein VX730_07585 [Pseudomonadota bacterium]|nr:hypothetical protein [Pseudomonadota bacterium]
MSLCQRVKTAICGPDKTKSKPQGPKPGDPGYNRYDHCDPLTRSYDKNVHGIDVNKTDDERAAQMY